MLSNCGAGEDSESPLDSKEIKRVNPKGNKPWIFIGRTDAKTKTPILWSSDVKSWVIGKDPDVGKDWRRRRRGQQRGWYGLMASVTQWTWVWARFQSWWWTGKPDVLQSMGLQRVRHDWVTEMDWTELWAIYLWHVGSRALRLSSFEISCLMTCGIFPNQGCNLHALHYKVDS